MDKSYVKNVISGLKSTSSTRVQETLLKIKSKIISNDNGIELFRNCGGFEYLLPHLRKPNERILDITLSIIGNCCLEEESSLLVGKLNIYGPIINILKTVCRDSIVGRACRVIGNLAQKSVNAEALHNHGAVAALMDVIEKRDKNTSYPTLTMAVRAIRLLWMVIDKREEMLSQNAVRCIALLLTTECEAVGLIKSTNNTKDVDGFRKSQEELVIGILKCLGYFTTHSTAFCAEQIQGDGRGYQCLVALTKSHESLALKCLMNLCYLSSCRPLLGIAGFVECLVGILQKSSDVSWWPEGSVKALAALSGESVNRSRLRHCGGLPLLVSAAKLSSHALHALLQYVFDDTSFQILINEGLISLLTDELTKHISTMEIEHNNLENTDMMSDTILPLKSMGKEVKKFDVPEKIVDKKIDDNRTFRRKSLLAKNEDELKVVIERDNMIVGFVDAVDSDASDSQSDDEGTSTNKKKCLKRARSGSPKSLLKKCHKPQLIKMANKDWSAGVYWEPKSPEWPNQPSGSRITSPERPDFSPKSPYSDGNQSGFSPEYSGLSSNKRPKFDWSPQSGVSSGEGSSSSAYWTEYQWSPSSSNSPSSPYSLREESSDSEISGRYSPVCSSECESDAGVIKGPCVGVAPICGNDASDCRDIDAVRMTQHLDDLAVDDEDSCQEDAIEEEDANPNEINTKSSRIACVLVLMFRVSHGACNYSVTRDDSCPNHTLELLTGKECLNALLDYVEKCKRPLGRAARILARVMSNALCLMNILKHRLALRLHNMSVTSKHATAKCQQCKQIVRLSTKLLSQLTILAESSYGIGEISYQLLKGNAEIKQTLSLTLPYIVRSEKPLKKYFVDCSALNMLLSIIAQSKEKIQDCVTALAKLAMNLQIKDPKSLENKFKDLVQITYDPILDNLLQVDIVTFQLDDDTTVQANKVFLCQNSDVFCAMLMGQFKESVEKCVRLKNVTKPALEYLITLLHIGLNSPKSDVQVFPMSESLKTNLEVLLLSDRFLFDHLKVLLCSAILQFQLSPETADEIYIWSLNEGMGFLCVESVAYLLTGKMCEKARTKCFKNIFSLKYKDQWLEDIKSMILRQLVK